MASLPDCRKSANHCRICDVAAHDSNLNLQEYQQLLMQQLTLFNLNYAMKNNLVLAISCCTIIFLSCTRNVDEELNPDNNCATSEISFNQDISPILDVNCNGCHNSSARFGNVVLDSHEGVKRTVDAGRLLGAIRREAGFSPMPQNANKLSDCNIEKVEAWIQDGSLDN